QLTPCSSPSSISWRLRRRAIPARLPYTTLFRSVVEPHREDSRPLDHAARSAAEVLLATTEIGQERVGRESFEQRVRARRRGVLRSEEHTSELQSREDLVCRLLLEKNNGILHEIH